MVLPLSGGGLRGRRRPVAVERRSPLGWRCRRQSSHCGGGASALAPPPFSVQLELEHTGRDAIPQENRVARGRGWAREEASVAYRRSVYNVRVTAH